jgi:hypothetical protein
MTRDEFMELKSGDKIYWDELDASRNLYSFIITGKSKGQLLTMMTYSESTPGSPIREEHRSIDMTEAIHLFRSPLDALISHMSRWNP